MKTKEEIIRGFEICYNYTSDTDCDQCPYFRDTRPSNCSKLVYQDMRTLLKSTPETTVSTAENPDSDKKHACSSHILRESSTEQEPVNFESQKYFVIYSKTPQLFNEAFCIIGTILGYPYYASKGDRNTFAFNQNGTTCVLVWADSLDFIIKHSYLKGNVNKLIVPADILAKEIYPIVNALNLAPQSDVIYMPEK